MSKSAFMLYNEVVIKEYIGPAVRAYNPKAIIKQIFIYRLLYSSLKIRQLIIVIPF